MGTFNRRNIQNGVFRLPPIKRKTNEELDAALADLEKRGFRVVKRGSVKREVKDFKYNMNSKTPKQFVGSTEFQSVWAIVENDNERR